LPFVLGVAIFALGIFSGVKLTLMVQIQSMPLIRDNIIAGMAVEDAYDTVPGRPGLLSDPQDQPPQQP
jgi:hypothetical protein